MEFSVGDIQEFSSIVYDDEPLDSVEQIFERLYAPTRQMARKYPEIHKRGMEDSYRKGFFGGGELQELEDKQEKELEKDVEILLKIADIEEPITYSVHQINDNEKRYASNAPCSVLLEDENGDRFVLHEAKEYLDPGEAFHFGGKNVDRFQETDNGSGYVSIHEFFEGLKSIYGVLEAADGLSPLAPSMGIVEDKEGYDPKTGRQTYYLRNFDQQATHRTDFPEVDNLAELAATLDLLGIRRADTNPDEILYSDEGFLYEADLEKLMMVEETSGDETMQPGLSRIHSIFDKVHLHPEGGRLKLDGTPYYTDEIKAAIESEYPTPDVNPMELRENFRNSITDWIPENLPEPFIDLRN